jgi:hypothetical protein
MEIIIFIVIHVVIPVLGLIWYISIVGKMKKENIVERPIMALFVLFATYGGLLVMALTSLFWYWSGMASLGMAYLILLAPIVMLVFALVYYKKRNISKYHVWIFNASWLYFIIAPWTFLILYYIGRNK